jgi:hypothetical protein
MTTMSHLPFAYTLIDKRHRPFVEGRRRGLLSPIHVIMSRSIILSLLLGGMGLLFFLRIGVGGLAYDFSVRNEWVLTDATITGIFPVQSDDRFNWFYIYTFQTEDGQQTSGKVVESNRGAFQQGQRIPVRYLRTNPKENTYANDPMPKSVLYWVLVALGVLWCYISIDNIRRASAWYNRIRTISSHGRGVAAQITRVRQPSRYPNNINVEIEYAFTSPTGTRLVGRDLIPVIYLTCTPGPGMVVAVWYADNFGAVLL